jgi:tRNA (adenine57-N1/adenine58-N1)-methyltransferase
VVGAFQEQEYKPEWDRVILDMLAPWDCVEAAAKALVPGGVILAYVATTTQLSRFAEALKESDLFTEPESTETIVRGWHHEGLAVRPQHRMIGHTGFLTVARRMAPGVSVLQRRRRPSKGSYGVAE